MGTVFKNTMSWSWMWGA